MQNNECAIYLKQGVQSEFFGSVIHTTCELPSLQFKDLRTLTGHPIYRVRFKRCQYILIKNNKDFRRNEFDIFFHMFITLAKKMWINFDKKEQKFQEKYM